MEKTTTTTFDISTDNGHLMRELAKSKHDFIVSKYLPVRHRMKKCDSLSGRCDTVTHSASLFDTHIRNSMSSGYCSESSV